MESGGLSYNIFFNSAGKYGKYMLIYGQKRNLGLATSDMLINSIPVLK